MAAHQGMAHATDIARQQLAERLNAHRRHTRQYRRIHDREVRAIRHEALESAKPFALQQLETNGRIGFHHESRGGSYGDIVNVGAGGNAQPGDPAIAHEAQPTGKYIDLVDELVGHLEHVFAGAGGRHVASGPFEDADAEFPFESGNAPAQSRLADIESAGRPSEMAMTCQG